VNEQRLSGIERALPAIEGVRTLQTLVASLGVQGEKTALLALGKQGEERWSFRELSERARAFAHQLAAEGVRAGDSVVLYAENRPGWIAAALGTLRAGAVVAPIDVQFGDEDLAHILRDSAARAVITTRGRAARIETLGRTKLILLDDEDAFAAAEESELPFVRPNDPAVLFYTSGTTGAPKGVPLTHRNIACQLDVIATLNLVGAGDRILLPLPLHHVYPFVIGMLTPLSLGLPIVLPFSLTGQQLLRALREGEVSAIIGVPRLYSALVAGIKARVESSGRVARSLFRGLLALSSFLRRSSGLRAGKALFASLRNRFGGNLRLVASGGSALDPALAETLESLGWEVAIGYGLTETSPLLSINLPNEYKQGSVGKPFPGVELRIAAEGEIQARGPTVFAGYRNLSARTAEAFTPDGWFRTGDLGWLDEDGFLHITGRSSTLIKTESGEKVQTEDVEAAYAKEPAIREIGVLERNGKLVAVIVPNRAACGDDVEAAVRGAIERVSRSLPSYERISDYAITSDILPHTRLGKIQRHRLGGRFNDAKNITAKSATTGPMPLEEMSGEDRALFEEAVAQPVWQLLVRRYPDKRLTPDTSLQFDLAVDSLEWLNLTLEIAEKSGVEITEEAIARIDTVRDLLREVLEAGEGAGVDPLAQPYAILNEAEKRWLLPLGFVSNVTARFLYAVGRVLMRLFFRVNAEGLENVPMDRPWIMTPNHVSYLDPFALAAVLSWSQLRATYWAGWTGIVTANAFMRFLSRLGRILPVEPTRAARSGLALGAIVLQSGKNLVWFPEGGRSPTGEVQPFKPGIGMLVERFPTAVLPVSIQGTREAMPLGAKVPRLRPIRVLIGKPCTADELMREGHGEKPHERIANALQAKVAGLGGHAALPTEEARR
jgi:long-chain acyl-CoA synthetase